MPTQETDHIFLENICACVCGPGRNETDCTERDVGNSGKEATHHEWHEEDCSCRCKPDKHCHETVLPLMHMNEQCRCVCDEATENDCTSRLKDPEGNQRWKWDDEACECQCALQPSDCKDGKDFFEPSPDRSGPGGCNCECDPTREQDCRSKTEAGKKLAWFDDGCECRCTNQDDKKQCVLKRSDNQKQGALDSTNWQWIGPDECKCTCTATEDTCTSAAKAAKSQGWVPKPDPDCGCQCDVSKARTPGLSARSGLYALA